MRHTKTIGTLTAAAVGLGLATAGVAVAHPQGGPGGEGGPGGTVADGPQAGAGPQAENPRAGRRGPRGPRGIARRCNIAEGELLTVDENERLKRLQDRLAQKVTDEDITQERADRVFNRKQKMITIRVTRRTERMEPVLALGLTKAELKDARENGTLDELLASKGISEEAFRDARRQGRRDARVAVRALCTSGNADAEQGAGGSGGPSI